MDMIIKNLDKYKDIKLAKGIYLDNIQTLKRKGNIGVSTMEFGNKWFKLSKGNAIFKSFDKKDEKGKIKPRDEVRQNRIVNEFICSELCKQVGIPCADIDPANYHNIVGLVSYNVANENQKLINAQTFFDKTKYEVMCENNMSNYAMAIDVINQKSNKQLIDKDKMLKHLFKIIVFDYLTMQTDRHIFNVFFLEDKTTHEIKVAPLLDNEFAFFSIGLANGVFYSNENKDIDDLIYLYGKIYNRMRIRGYNENKRQDFTLKDITMLAKAKPEYKAILEDMLNNIDIQKAVQNVENLGFVISNEYKQFVSDIVLGVKQKIIDEYKNLGKVTIKTEKIL